MTDDRLIYATHLELIAMVESLRERVRVLEQAQREMFELTKAPTP